MQQNSWAHGRPTHGRETSPNRTHAISKHPPSLYKVPTYSTRAGAAPRAPRGARHGGGNRAVNSQPGTGQSTLHGHVKSSYRGGKRVGQEGVRDMGTQQRHQTRGGATQTHKTREPHQRGQGRAHQTRRRGTARQERLPERREQGTRMEQMVECAHGRQRQERGWLGQPTASLPGARATPAQPASGGGCLRSPDGLFAQQEREPIRGRPTVSRKRTYGGRPGQRVEEQGTWAAQKHSKAGYGRPVDRGVWTAKTVKRPRQQPAHPQYANYWANYWAPLTRKRHTMPHSAQFQHANYWAPRTQKRHRQEHRPQRPTESSDPTQHAKGRTGDRPGPRKGATTRRNVTQGGYCCCVTS